MSIRPRRQGYESSCPWDDSSSLPGLESVPQRELDQPRRPRHTCDLAERTVSAADGFHVGHCRIRKVGVVPRVEKVGCEAQALALGDLEIPDQREVPVLLARAAESVAPKVSEARGAVVAVHQALGRVELQRRRLNESIGIQIAISDPAPDAAAAKRAAKRSSRRQAAR